MAYQSPSASLYWHSSSASSPPASLAIIMASASAAAGSCGPPPSAAVTNGIRDFYASTPASPALAQLESTLSTFLASVPSSSRVVLVTSGGTLVPLEQNTVRFVDNFSTGTRGAALAENAIDTGAYVIFMHRTGSAVPFLRRVASVVAKQPGGASAATSFNSFATLAALSTTNADISTKDSSNDQLSLQFNLPATPASRSVVSALARFESSRARLLPLEFSSITEYLFALRSACAALRPIGRRALVLLAAAVSDYYIPASEQSVHKLDSRADGALVLTMAQTPKVLHALRHAVAPPALPAIAASSSATDAVIACEAWLPDAFVCSFKLETDASILLRKSRAALRTYDFNAVLANELHTRYAELRIVRNRSTSADHNLQPAAAASSTDPDRDVEVVRPTPPSDAAAVDDPFARELEVPLVARLTQLHQQWIQEATPQQGQD